MSTPPAPTSTTTSTTTSLPASITDAVTAKLMRDEYAKGAFRDKYPGKDAEIGDEIACKYSYEAVDGSGPVDREEVYLGKVDFVKLVRGEQLYRLVFGPQHEYPMQTYSGWLTRDAFHVIMRRAIKAAIDQANAEADAAMADADVAENANADTVAAAAVLEGVDDEDIE